MAAVLFPNAQAHPESGVADLMPDQLYCHEYPEEVAEKTNEKTAAKVAGLQSLGSLHEDPHGPLQLRLLENFLRQN